MKKITAMLLTTMLLLSLCACGGNNQQQGSSTPNSPAAPVENTGETYTWKLGTIYNDPAAKPEYNAFGMAVQKFCELVEKKTDGQVKVEPYYSSVLGGSAELWGSLRDNEIQVFYGQPMSTADPRFGAWNIPYMFTDYDQVAELIANPDAPLFKQAAGWMEEDGVHLVAIGTAVFRGFFNIKHEVGPISDLRDLKCRTYEDRVVQTFWGDVCNATSLPFSEVYTGLQTGTVDGLEFGSTNILSSKYYEIANPSYYSDVNWQWTSGSNLVVSQEAWDELPDDLKEIVTECAWEAQDFYRTENDANEIKALDDLAANGTVIHTLTDDERQTWIDHARSLDGTIKEMVGEEVWDEIWAAIDSYSQGN